MTTNNSGWPGFRLLALSLFIALLAAPCTSGWAQPAAKYIFKVATLAPDGSVWVKQFQDFAKEVSDKSGDEIQFKLYPGGIMGDDQAMYRKMRVGQLNGGGFTMTGIADVVPDFRVLAIPFLFGSYDEVDTVRNSLIPYFKNKFKEQGLEFIAMTEVGFIYTMSTQPVASMADLKKGKSWAPSGDPITGTFLAKLGITPIPLSIPDVLSSLQTGLVDTVFNSLYGSIVLQWYTKARYITDIPFGYAYGAFLLDRKTFAKLPENYAALIHSAADRHFSTLLADTRKSNEESRQVLEQNGVTFVAADPGIVDELREEREKTVEQLRGSAFSPEAYNIAAKALEDYRKTQPDASR
ncbi:MAG: TRAP transporter substrate-binding protein DctP [Desulfocapsaceae bacterium]|nr:TRAP transporter substrate-binding protein DctP [Desulfocapsaceae bacterium]